MPPRPRVEPTDDWRRIALLARAPGQRTTSTGFVLVGLPPQRRLVGTSGRASYSRERTRHLSAEERAAVRALAHTKSLRSLAADLGVSHETVHRVLREAVAAVA